jgi:multiple sugar transport system permease protein
VVIAAIRTSGGVADYGGQYVGILISVVPIIIIFCFCSSLILDKISIGSAIKG